MKALKYALYALGGLIVLLMVVVGIVFATFDPNAYKPQIVQMVKERTGRTLSIDGNIGLKVFPKIGATVGKTTLSERGNDNERALECVLVGLRKPQKDRGVQDLSQQHGAQNRPDECSASAAEACPTKNDSRDTRQRVIYSLPRITDANLGHQHHRADRSQKRAGNIAEQEGAIDPYTDPSR